MEEVRDKQSQVDIDDADQATMKEEGVEVINRVHFIGNRKVICHDIQRKHPEDQVQLPRFGEVLR